MNIIIKENWGCALHPRTIASIAFISRSFGFPSSISPLSPCPRLLFRHLSIHADLRSLHLCLFEIRFLSPRSSCEFAIFCKFRCFLGIFLLFLLNWTLDSLSRSILMGLDVVFCICCVFTPLDRFGAIKFGAFLLILVRMGI